MTTDKKKYQKNSRSNLLDNPEWESLRKRYAGAQADFTGSGILGEDGIGINRSLRIKDKIIKQGTRLHQVSVSSMINLLIQFSKEYSKLYKQKKQGKKVAGDISGS